MRFHVRAGGATLTRLLGWVVGGAVLAVGLAIWNLRLDALAEAEIQTKNLAAVIAEVAGGSVQAVDVVLRELQERFTVMALSTPEAFRDALKTRPMNDLLRSRAYRLPQVDVIALIGGDGGRVNYSMGWPIEPEDFTDRDFFQHFVAGYDTSLYVSEPLLSRTTGQWSVMLVRGVYGPTGSFVGLILANLPLRGFHDFLGSIRLLTDATFLLTRRDGTVLVRHPDPAERAGERMPAGSEWYRLVAAGGGTYTSPGYFDAIGRLVAVHPMDRYPLVVDVGITKQAALAHWRRETAVIVPATLCAAACLLVLLRALRRQFIRLGRTLAAMHQGLIMVDAGGKVVVCNARAADMLELPAGLLASHPPFAAIAAGSPAAAALNAPGAQAGGVRTCQSPDGGILEMRRIALAGGGFLATFEDVTARRRAEAQVVFLARHDPLTRLPNRAAFVERLEQAVALAGRGSITAVLCLDLDHFKKINDTLGHPVGDLLLREVANRVSACLREVDLVARFGGDEFAVVQFDPKGIDDVALLAQRIIDALSRPFDLDGHQAVISASLGIALVPADGADPDVLLKNADIALYRAKEEGRGTFCFFAAEMDARLQERRRLELDLRHAVQHNEFELHYQPMVNLATQLVCGFEALLRWNHPTRGSLEPAAFIGLVEETGLIGTIGQWVLRQACQAAALWPPGVRVAINLSAVQFHDPSLVGSASQALAEAGLPAGRLELEITEAVLLEGGERVLSVLHQLRELGVLISMDDFGTGYSSLSYLRCFPFDKIKIDRSFIRDLPDSKEAEAIVRAIARLGASLGMATTAEGVETPAQLACLRAEGCTEVQGFLFSPPRPAAEVPQILSRIDHPAPPPRSAERQLAG